MANPRQAGFFDGNHPKSAQITIRERHELLLLADAIPWPDLIEAAVNARLSQVKAPSGPQPHYRELLGAVALMAVRNVTYREAEELLYYMIDQRYNDDELVELGFAPSFIKTIRAKIRFNQFKRVPPIIAKVSNRTINVDFRYNRDWGS